MGRLSAGQLATELLPNLMQILAPRMRPVNTSLFSAREKADLAHLVALMLARGLDYVQEPDGDGQLQWRLTPSLDPVAAFRGLKPARSLSQAARALVAREIQLEQMRRSERHHAVTAGPCSISEQARTVRMSGSNRTNVFGCNVPRDFFGMPLQPKSLSSLPLEANAAGQTVKNPLNDAIWFKYKEGYSNAVRRSVCLRDILGLKS